MQITNSDLMQLAEQVKELYSQHRRMIHSGYRPSPRHAKCWLNLAKLLIEHGFPPEEYMAAQFQARKCSYPFPNQLYSALAIKNFKEHKTTVAKELTVQLKLELEAMQTMIKRGIPMEHIARNEDNEFSDLFIYCVLKRFNLQPSGNLKQRVKIYLMTNPMAVDVYSKVFNGLDQEFKRASIIT